MPTLKEANWAARTSDRDVKLVSRFSEKNFQDSDPRPSRIPIRHLLRDFRSSFLRRVRSLEIKGVIRVPDADAERALKLLAAANIRTSVGRHSPPSSARGSLTPFLAQLAEAGIAIRVETEVLGFDFDDFSPAF
jgi:hypothetical protein